MKKLKDVLKESNVWDRKFGEPLPTLADTTARHAAKQNQINEAPIDGDRQMITRAIENMTEGRLKVGQIQIEIGKAIDQAHISDIMKQNLKYAMQIKK